MKRILEKAGLVLCVAALGCFPVAGSAVEAQAPAEATSEIVVQPEGPAATAIHALLAQSQDFLFDGITFSDPQLARFYEARAWRPAWTRMADVNDLSTVIGAVADHGLDPARFPTPMTLSSSAEDFGGDANRDLMLTATFLRYAAEVSRGLVRPRRLYADYDVPEPAHLDAVAALERALLGEEGGMTVVLGSLAPPHAGYWRLVDAHKELMTREDWPAVKKMGRKLKPGKNHKNVPLLRARLNAEPDVTLVAPEDETVYDLDLEKAVRVFQERHGLLVDGVVGPRTLRTLNVTRTGRLDQMRASLERWRWLPRDLGTAHIVVNAASNTLRAVNDGKLVFDTKVITGDHKNQTPMLHSKLSQMVLNPPWYVPESIATEEIMFKAKEDPEYLRRNNIRVLELEEEDPFGDTVDWEVATDNGEIYRFRQDPGAGNALGHLKLHFRNKYGVYLHDTSSRRLFGRAGRNLSHGCVRVQGVFDLAAIIATPHNGYTRTRIDRAIAKGDTRYLPMPEEWNIYLLYWTAFVDEDGVPQFRHDIYRRDKVLLQAMDRAAARRPGYTASAR